MNFRITWSLIATVAAMACLSINSGLVIAADTVMTTKPDTAPVRIGEAENKSAASLTLAQALALAMKHNPELSVFSHELRANEGTVLQAGALPNPVLDLTGDGLNNSRLRQDGDRTTSIQIGQLIELGGKRSARIRIAETGRDLANWDYEAKRIDVLMQTSQYFIDTMAAQQAAQLADESLKLAQDVAGAVGKRVLAGKVSPIEETKARLALSAAQIEMEQIKRQLTTARKNLASMWAEQEPSFERVTGNLETLPALPAYPQLTARIRDNPDLARWNSEIARRQATVDAEKAKAVPDVTLSVGRTRFSQFEDHAYMLGVSIPIPLFDRNRGGILEANRRLDKAGDEQRAAESRLLTALSEIFQRLSAIRSEIETLRTDILPGANSAYAGATKGYQLGKFGILDVLDGQRTLFQARTQYLKALTDYHRGHNEIERLIGSPLSTTTPVTGKP